MAGSTARFLAIKIVEGIGHAMATPVVTRAVMPAKPHGAQLTHIDRSRPEHSLI
jgi:hypothetical protein